MDYHRRTVGSHLFSISYVGQPTPNNEKAPMPGYEDVEHYLNERDTASPHRRKHHLPPDRYRQAGVAFFVTLCARHRRDVFRDSRVSNMVLDALKWGRERGIWAVYAYCLMPDHLHAVLQLRSEGDTELLERGLLEHLERFKSFTTHEAWKLGLVGKLWQRDAYDRLLRSDSEFSTRCTYVLNNPVRKGWVEDWTEWPYSGILDDW